MKVNRLVLLGLLGIVGAMYPSMGWTHKTISHDEMLASLQGISGVNVAVEVGFSRGGPTQVAFQTMTEVLLQKGGVTVLHQTDEKGNPLSPSLCIEIAVVKRKASFFTYFIRESLIQNVTVARAESVSLKAPTWTKGLIGEGNVELIQRDLKKLVEVFLKDFHKAKKVN